MTPDLLHASAPAARSGAHHSEDGHAAPRENGRVPPALMARVAGGDQAALAEVYDGTRRLVYGLACQMLPTPEEAEEVALDVYLRVWRHAARFDARRGSVEAWLATLTRHRAIDWLRARKARPESGGLSEVDEPDAPPAVEDASNPEWSTAASRRRRALVRALAHLSDDQRRLIRHAFLLGYTHAELAQRFQLPLGTVKTRIRTGLLAMREAMATHGAPG